MRIARVLRINWQVARRVGRQEYDGAIHILERELSGGPSDSPYLELIAQCHLWAKREDLAIEFAKKVLEFEPSSIESIKVLTRIYAKRTEHELTARYVRHGLEHFPKPLPTTPKALFGLLHLASLVFPRLNAIEERASRDISDPNRNNNEWHTWAKEYLAWYDQRQGARITPTIDR